MKLGYGFFWTPNFNSHYKSFFQAQTPACRFKVVRDRSKHVDSQMTDQTPLDGWKIVST